MHLSEFINQNSERIVRAWEDFAKTLASGGPLPRWILRDHASAIITFITQEMETDQPMQAQAKTNAEDALQRVSAAHGTLRIESGFDLAEVVAEYRALGRCVLSLWQLSEPSSFSNGAAEITRFVQVLDDSLGAAVSAYEQREVQYRDLFLGILGHDLRNPINAISFSAINLASSQLDDQQRLSLSRILNSTARLGSMVNDVLDFARGRLGSTMPLNVASANLATMVREVIDEVRTASPDSSITFSTTGDLDGHWDTERLKQALSNLLLNALEHGTGKTADVIAKREDDFVTLEVHNDGPPIPQESLGVIFDPLVRVIRPNQKQTGLGLGLYIVNEIVRAHGGTVTVTSTVEAGTSFIVRLPISRDDSH